MRNSQHLWITLDESKGDHRQVVVDKDRDIRVCDGSLIVKIRFDKKKIKDVLVNDVFCYVGEGW